LVFSFGTGSLPETVLNYKNNNKINTQAVGFGQPELITAAIGLIALTFGVLIYVFDRSATAVYFVPDSWRVAESTPLLFGTLGQYLPAFFHALAFALFINVIAGRRYIGFMCVSWFVAEVFFELAQIDPIAFRISGVLPGWFAELPILQNISSHFLTGRFDRIDVLFLLFGCATAYAICWTALPQLHNGLRARSFWPTRIMRLAVLMFVALVGFTSIVSSGGTGDASLTIVKAPSAAPKLPLRDPSLRG
jgi:hypothetical protein